MWTYFLHLKNMFTSIETLPTLICTYGHKGILLHKATDKEGMLHNGICVAGQKQT